MADADIRGYEQDEEGHWVAKLSCGHKQHLRHEPPFQEREWVMRASGRDHMLGEKLDCLFCNMPTLPEEVAAYNTTRIFDETSVPKGLLANHTTKAGIWGRIVVNEGRLLYTIDNESWVLRPDVVGIVAPERAHKVAPQGPVRFYVEFLK